MRVLIPTAYYRLCRREYLEDGKIKTSEPVLQRAYQSDRDGRITWQDVEEHTEKVELQHD